MTGSHPCLGSSGEGESFLPVGSHLHLGTTDWGVVGA